jgi:hypothetical protein
MGWFVVQFDGGTGLKVGSFTKSTAAGAQVIPHGLGQTPKAMIFWTEGRPDETFSNATGIAFRQAASTDVNGSALTLQITVPPLTVNNDVMIAGITVRPNTAVITPPGGWTLVLRQNQALSTASSIAV